MPFATITPPPGVVKPGTVYEAKGRWYDTLWVRWFERVMQAIGGFEAVEIGGSQVDMSERVSGTWSWKDNDGYALLAYGGPTTMKILRAGAEYDITPSAGFTNGAEDAVITSGNYGSGDYGDGIYGVGDEITEILQEAQSYAMDNYGEDLVFVALSDGDIWYCDVDGDSGDPAEAVNITPSAGTVPTGNVGVVVTPENFLVALGAGGDPRKIQWPDQDDYTDWAPTDVNQAGDAFLTGRGAILAGRRAKDETLIWTETNLYSLRYIGGEFIYTVVEVGAEGAISRRCMGIVGSVAYWMGPRGFFIYNGFTESLPSDLADYVFRDINLNQLSKVWCETRQQFGEVTWHYPSASSEECDRSVTYNYRDGVWYNNAVARTAGEDAGALPYPVAFDAAGLLYRHEIGSSYGGAVPTAISGPLEIGAGDRVMSVTSLIPDEKTQGDVDLYLLTSFYPNGEETENGPYAPANPTSLRLVARQMRVKVVEDEPGWRLGVVRADIDAEGER